jgi:hypothetical protein
MKKTKLNTEKIKKIMQEKNISKTDVGAALCCCDRTAGRHIENGFWWYEVQPLLNVLGCTMDDIK